VSQREFPDRVKFFLLLEGDGPNLRACFENGDLNFNVIVQGT